MFLGEEPIHIKCESREDIAPIVIMPGDPLRAKYIAEKYLTDAKLVTSVRNMLGYTGYYKGVKVTTMGSGMGMPSMSIYSFELFHFFNVQKIIRIGTCGVVTPEIVVPELILADCFYSETNFDFSYESINRGLLYPDKELNQTIIETAKEKDEKLHIGTVLTCDAFGPYIHMDKVLARVPEYINVIAEEMEGYALALVGQEMERKIACILTAVDSKFSKVFLTPEQREQALDDMIILALDSIIK